VSAGDVQVVREMLQAFNRGEAGSIEMLHEGVGQWLDEFEPGFPVYDLRDGKVSRCRVSSDPGEARRGAGMEG
jgi:hypothetical protein